MTLPEKKSNSRNDIDCNDVKYNSSVPCVPVGMCCMSYKACFMVMNVKLELSVVNQGRFLQAGHLSTPSRITIPAYFVRNHMQDMMILRAYEVRSHSNYVVMQE